jgi:hypothetical protein
VWALAAAVLGFFVITLGAVVLNVALPSIRGDLGSGISVACGLAPGMGALVAAPFVQGAAAAGRPPKTGRRRILPWAGWATDDPGCCRSRAPSGSELS